MLWPALFLPALCKNTFPASGRGRTRRHPRVEEDPIPGAAHYLGAEADERRPLYVAVTRAQKYLAHGCGRARASFGAMACRVVMPDPLHHDWDAPSRTRTQHDAHDGTSDHPATIQPP
ncbi:hypothetical protein [Streptomyces sp. CMB-StM0423]|uniref:hypothetical protein n=1 Tax=Streptomyces sp. CMB-StM0423 TaxID=2059884 RepID=UPI001F3F2D84|nr:hypothetical protein [Streptomyces sp. CMB-StM0423]